MLLSDPPHSLHQAQKKIMTQCSSNYTKWESFTSHHSLCCALSALQPPRAGRGSTIPLQQCWITQDGRGSQTLPPLKFLFSLLGTTLLIALPCRFCSLPSVTSRLQLQEVPRSEVCQMYASPASPSSTTVPHLHMNAVLPRGCCCPTDILKASGAHSPVQRCPKPSSVSESQMRCWRALRNCSISLPALARPAPPPLLCCQLQALLLRPACR